LGVPAVTILLVARDAHAAKSLCSDLGASGFRTLVVTEGRAALEQLSCEEFEIALIEFVPPACHRDGGGCVRMDSFQLLRRVRLVSDVGVIVLSQEQGEALKLYFLDSGADDYVRWPCRRRELELRVRAVMRRAARDGRS
jgi:DNA-binding response OmpR family regulator